jgi:hypothetical protein
LRKEILDENTSKYYEKFPSVAPQSSEIPLNGPDASCVDRIYIGYPEHTPTGGGMYVPRRYEWW